MLRAESVAIAVDALPSSAFEAARCPSCPRFLSFSVQRLTGYAIEHCACGHHRVIRPAMLVVPIATRKDAGMPRTRRGSRDVKALAVLQEGRERALTAGQVASQMGWDTSNALRVLRRLERDGLAKSDTVASKLKAGQDVQIWWLDSHDP